MKSLDEIKDTNDRAAASELAELRADTVKGLRFAFQERGIQGVLDILRDAVLLYPLFDSFQDKRREDAG